MAVRTFIPVRYVECDPMGVVHHSNYFVWYEIGRIALAREAGVNFHEREDGTLLLLPVIECKNRFISSARFGDTVEVETDLIRPSKAQINFTYRVFRQKGRQLLAEGATSHVLTTLEGRLLWHLPPLLKQKIDAFLDKES